MSQIGSIWKGAQKMRKSSQKYEKNTVRKLNRIIKNYNKMGKKVDTELV